MIELIFDPEITSLPMILIEMIKDEYETKLHIGIDSDYCVYLYLEGFDRVKHKKLLTDITGRGLTYQDACIDYINKLLDNNYQIRYTNTYATTKIRKLINKTNYKRYYLNNLQ